mmetsp:Transcript_53081/g.60827  ORF Transcript_53081/g.60827 Transcript_53081/m.60827 type:complete len:282 (+) Transcript_53081:1-846(+)
MGDKRKKMSHDLIDPKKPFEQLALEVHDEQNLLRQNPAQYAIKLEDYLQYFDDKELRLPNQVPVETYEGTAAVKEAIEELKRTAALPDLQWKHGLAQAALSHARDVGKRGKTGHLGSDGSHSRERIERFGKWDKVCGENIDYANFDARDIICMLLIDDGISDRGHRNNLLNPEFKTSGVGIGFHTTYSVVTVITYAGQYREKKGVFGPEYSHEEIAHHVTEEQFKDVKEDEIDDWPHDAVSRKIKTETRFLIGRKQVITQTLYQFADGSTKEIIDSLTSRM